MGIRSQLFIAALGASVCVGAAFAVTPQAVEAAADRDVIIAMIDDAGSPAHRRIFDRQPNIKRTFVKGGVEVTQIRSETPQCSPGRAGLLTGQHTYNHGVVNNTKGYRLPDRETINAAFVRNGAEAHLIGKSIKGTGSQPPGWTKTAVMGGSDPTIFTINGKKVNFGSRWKDDVVRTQALKWLDATPDNKQIFQWVSFVAPHVQPYSKTSGRSYVPYVIKRDRGAAQCRYMPKYNPKSYTHRTNPREAYPMPNWPMGWQLKTYCESLINVDRYVGQAVKLLNERGRPWVFILVADNGMSWGISGFSQKHTYTASRQLLYVAGSDGTEIQKGTNLNALLSSIDIAPTIADLAGVNLPTADGISFKAGLQGKSFAGREWVFQTMITENANRYKTWHGLFYENGHYLVKWIDGKRQLFDWKKDSSLSKDLASARPVIRNKMTNHLKAINNRLKN